MQFKYKKLQYRNLNKEVDDVTSRLNLLVGLFGMLSLIILLMAISLYLNSRLTHRIVESIATSNEYVVSSSDFYDNLDPCVLADVECNWEIEKNLPKILTNQTVYGYNSLPNQTDSDPCIAASLINLCEGQVYRNKASQGGVQARVPQRAYSYIANNCYPFGTIVDIGDRTNLVVVDRMNARYGCDVWDVWFSEYDEAIQWGKRKVDIKIYE